MSQINNRAQVPGYCGYIPGKNSQNKFGTTFGHVTKGSYTTQHDAFLTTNIHNNEFIQKQYTGDHRFWGNEGKLNAFNESTKQPIKHNKRIDAPSNKLDSQNLFLKRYQLLLMSKRSHWHLKNSEKMIHSIPYKFFK